MYYIIYNGELEITNIHIICIANTINSKMSYERIASNAQNENRTNRKWQYYKPLFSLDRISLFNSG